MTMTNVTRALKKAFALIGTGTVVTTVYAFATGSDLHPTLGLGAGALMGLGIFMVIHTQEMKQK